MLTRRTFISLAGGVLGIPAAVKAWCSVGVRKARTVPYFTDDDGLVVPFGFKGQIGEADGGILVPTEMSQDIQRVQRVIPEIKTPDDLRAFVIDELQHPERWTHGCDDLACAYHAHR